MKEKRIIYMGTPQFSATILETLIQEGYNIVAVVTQSDKKVGRKQLIEFSEVKKIALKYGIDILQPIKIRTDYDSILAYEPECIVTCAYGQIVPDEILNYPRHKCINIHASLLPKYRGGAPIHQAIIDGETETGVTIMEMVSKMDAGDMCYWKKHPITEKITTTELFIELAEVGKQAILEVLPAILSDTAQFIPQDETQVSYAYTIKKEREYIDVTQPIKNVYNLIRGLSDVPGAYVYVNDKKIKLFDITYEECDHQQLGQIIYEQERFKFYFSDGILYVKTLQLEGKVKMDAKTFYNGYGKNCKTFR